MCIHYIHRYTHIYIYVNSGFNRVIYGNTLLRFCMPRMINADLSGGITPMDSEMACKIL